MKFNLVIPQNRIKQSSPTNKGWLMQKVQRTEIVLYNPDADILTVANSAFEIYWRLEFGGWYLIGEL